MTSVAVLTAPAPATSTLGANLVYVAGKLWLLAGVNGPFTAPTQRLAAEVFDPVAQTWTTKSSITTGDGRFVIASAVIGTNVYLLGGAYYPAAYPSFGLCYDTVADTWTSLPAPAALGAGPYYTFGSAGVIGGLIYFAFTSAINSTFGLASYNPATGTWTTLAAPPASPRTGGAAIGSKFYVFSDNNAYANVYKYTPGANTWQTVAVATINASDSMAALRSDGTTAVVFGGNASGITEAVAAYDSTTDAAPQYADIGSSHARIYFGFATVPGVTLGDDVIHVVGGYDRTYSLTPPQHFTLSFPVLRPLGPASVIPETFTPHATTLHAAVIRNMGTGTMTMNLTPAAGPLHPANIYPRPEEGFVSG